MRMNVRSRTTPTPTRGARASAWRALAFVACAAVALACSLLCARYARADTNYQDVWNSQSLDGGRQYIVGAWNVYDAAAFVCGYSSTTVKSWDLPTLGKLSNAPAIVALAESFANVTPWNDELLRDTCEGYFGSDLWNRMQSTYGGLGGIHFNSSGVNPVQLKYWQDNMPAGLHVYALNTTSEMVGAAKEAFRAILAGESTGGSNIDGDYLVFDVLLGHIRTTSTNVQSVVFRSVGNGLYYGNRVRTTSNGTSSDKSFLLPNSVQVRIPLSKITPTPTASDVFFLRWIGNNGIRLYRLQDGSTNDLSVSSYSFTTSGVDYSSDFYKLVASSAFTTSVESYASNALDYSNGMITYVASDVFVFESNTDSREFNAVDSNGVPTYGWIGTSGGGSGDPDPPNKWPDDDTNTTVAPSPPELPTPHDPTIPTEPDPDPPTYYTPPTPDPPSPDPPYEPIEPTNTTPTDYTPWLRAILLALGGISSDLATHCQHLQSQMKAQATRIITGINNQLVNLGTSINGAIEDWAKWLGECLGEGLNTLTDNLYDLFHWLADQFDFTFSGDPYDDSGIIGWLRRIYNRLGNGGDPKHYAPTILDPGSEGEDEPFDFWAWLLERIAAILGGVLGGATDAVSTLLDGIRGKFPFSIPWDLMAFLSLLSGNRAIPVFTFTIPAIQGWWSEVPIRVDLTPYDSAATACRSMVLIWWAFILAIKSTWMINDVLGAVASGIVSRFTGRLVGTAS